MDYSDPDVNRGGKKPRGKPFEKGLSGNPNGKLKGTRNATTLALESLLDGEGERSLRKLIEMADGGNIVAMRMVIDRILPPKRERPLQFDLPPLKTAADAVTAISRIAEGVGQGELSEGEARTLVGLVDTFVKCLESVETDLRMTAFEERISEIEAKKSGESSASGEIQTTI